MAANRETARMSTLGVVEGGGRMSGDYGFGM
jgi:hypothetical protein